MNISILDIQPDRTNRIKREFQGGYGLKINFGDSLKAKLLMKFGGGSHTPFFYLGYLAALAKQYGHDISYYYNNVPENCDMVIIHASMVAHYLEIDVARKYAKSGKKIYFIGPFASSMPNLFVDNNISVVVGEPEAAFQRIFSSGKLEEGTVPSPDIIDVDTIPFPYWDIFPYQTYTLRPKIHVTPVFPVLASRSCPFSCNYCPYLVMSKHYRRRSVENVVEELLYLVKRYNMKGVFFRDATFTANHDFIMRLIDAIKTKNLQFDFMCETRLDCLSKDMLIKLKSVGLRGINVGIETKDLDILSKNKRKPIESRNMESIIKTAERNGIKINAFYMFGYPEDSVTNILNTIEYAKLLNTYTALFYIYTPLPGTDGYEKLKDKITADWDKFDGYTLTYKHDILDSVELARLREKAYVSYYWRLSYMLKYAKQRLFT